MGRDKMLLPFLLCLGSTIPAAAAMEAMGDFNLGDTIRGLPNTIKSSLSTFKRGTGQMWRNGKEAGLIKKKVAAMQPPPAGPGDALSYSELVLLRKSGEDTLKLVQAGAVWLFVPELFPALLYFYPRALPSTFESEQGRAKRQGALARMRTRAAFELLATLEEQAVGKGSKAITASNMAVTADSLLRARAPAKALAYLTPSAREPLEGDKGFKELSKVNERQAKRALKSKGKLRVGEVSGAGKHALNGLPQPALKAGCKLIGNSGPQPGPLRRASLGKHLEQLVEADEVLAAKGVASLSREQLTEACLDRGFGSDLLTDAELRQRLEGWLQLVQPPTAKGGKGKDPQVAYEPHRLRLAAMAACAASSVRDERESLSTLPRLLLG